MENNKWADPTVLANVATALGIYSLIPFFFGLVDNNVGCIPWMFGGLICMIIAIIGLFKNGDLIGATANSILTVVCLFGNLYQAFITIIGRSGIPDNFRAALVMGDGMANLAAAIFCGSVAWIAWGANKCQSIAVAVPTVGFFLLFLTQMGIAGPFGFAPQICFTIFGTWLLYSGIAIMFHNVTGKQILPYIL